MFHFDKSCEISFQVTGMKEENICSIDVSNVYMASPEPATTTKPPKPTTGCKRKSHARESGWGMKSHGATRSGGSSGEEDMKKIMHRDTERQRRVAMSGLLNTLSSLLPMESAKGKRSVSDHIAKTVCYIKHLQGSIKDLADKRDRLRTLQDNSACYPPFEEDSSPYNIPHNVAIYTSHNGLEIQISGGNKEDGLRLSELLKVLLEEGLSVSCSVSSKVNGIFIHNIQCQISVTNNIDLQRLQRRLDDVCSNNSSSSIYEGGIDHQYCPFELMEKENQIYSSFLIM